MFLRGVLIAAVAVLGITVSQPVQEKIEPVDLNYQCIHMKDGEEKLDKSPVLLIHGLTASLKHWDGVAQVLSLRTGRRVCAVDLRNHGDSPWNNRTDVAALMEDISHILGKHNIQKVNIIGHSLGGKTAIHFALNNPEKVESLVVEDMRPNSMTETGLNLVKAFMNVLQQAIDSVPEGQSEEQAKKAIVDFFNNILEKMGASERIEEHEAKTMQIHLVNNKWQFKMNWKVLTSAFNDFENFWTVSKGLYTGPTMFIYGTKSDFKVGDDEKNILELFPNAKLVPVEGAGHSIHGVHKEFEDEVIKFLNNL